MTTPDRVLDVPGTELDDLRDRLRRTRWAAPWPAAPWAAGTDGEHLRRLVAHWADGYDWRRHEAAINALPHRFADVDGVRMHYLRFAAERPGAQPLLLMNGWPSSFLELVGLAERLSTPTRHGGRAEDAFTVVVPSLPGFAFSAQRPALGGPLRTPEIVHRLMHDVLGFARYGVHGSDLGAGEASWLAEAHPEAVTGLHLLDALPPADPDPATLSAEERAFVAAEDGWHAAEGGYSHEQRTRPLTLAQGLSDSPSGLLAWLLEKYRAWSDCGGDVSARFSDDFLLTQASLYWFTGTISTSFRPYYERGQGCVPRFGRVGVPTALALFPADIGGKQPRSWVERAYHLTRYTVMPRGGHFAAHEEPELLGADITAFFASLACAQSPAAASMSSE